MKKLFYILTAVILLNCSEDRLLKDSVVESNREIQNQTELDKWILDNITYPYGIAVKYRWNSNTVPIGSYLYPANPEKIKAVLETIKHLWIDSYELPNTGKKNFMKGKNPLVIYLYGNKYIDSKGVELMSNPKSTGAEMYIFGVDEFDPKNTDKVYLLMRSVHYQFAKRLMEIFPYQRDEFLQISQKRYAQSTEIIAGVRGSFKPEINAFKLSDYANKRGFYSIYGTVSAEDDFADMISITLCHTPKEIQNAAQNAKTPYQDSGSEPDVQIRYNEEAQQAYSEFIQKQNSVNKYFEKTLKINLNKLQLESIQRINNYTK